MPKIPSSPRVYVGIDPGQSGGLVAIRDGEILATPMPATDHDVWSWFDDLPPEKTVAVMEKVWGHVGQNQPGSRMFNFGAGFGALKMALVASGISHELVTPQAWQRALHIPAKKSSESKDQWKQRLRAHAQRLFPRFELWKVVNSKTRQLAIADALLIAEYCRRIHS